MTVRTRPRRAAPASSAAGPALAPPRERQRFVPRAVYRAAYSLPHHHRYLAVALTGSLVEAASSPACLHPSHLKTAPHLSHLKTAPHLWTRAHPTHLSHLGGHSPSSIRGRRRSRFARDERRASR